MEEQEEWVPVLGYENSYLVSNLGRVRSLIRKTQQPDNMMAQKYVRHTGRKIDPEDFKKYHDYKRVNLWNADLGKGEKLPSSSISVGGI